MQRSEHPLAHPPDVLEAAVREFALERAGAWFGLEDGPDRGATRVTLEPWRIRYWSFLRRVRIEWASNLVEPNVVWVKIPKADPAEHDLARVLASESDRDLARREAEAHQLLAGIGWETPDAPSGVRFVRFLDWRPELGAIITAHSPEPPLTPLLRRAKRRFSRGAAEEVRRAIRRAGTFLRRAHSRLPAPEERRLARRDETLARFEQRAAEAEESSSRFDPFTRIRRHAAELQSLLRSGYESSVPLVVTHRGVDARNVLDDGTRQTWLDPQESLHDVAIHDLARFAATLGMIDYGSVRGFAPPILPTPWVDALLEGYGAPIWLDARVLAAFTLDRFLERFDDARRIVQVQPWGPAVRGLFDSLYTRRFYGTLIGDTMTELGLP